MVQINILENDQQIKQKQARQAEVNNKLKTEIN